MPQKFAPRNPKPTLEQLKAAAVEKIAIHRPHVDDLIERANKAIVEVKKEPRRGCGCW